MARILVVDDTNVQLEVVMSALRDAGYEVEGATSQTDAIAKAPLGFDLFIVDIMLRITNSDVPDLKTLGGVQVIKHLRQDPTTADKPIITLTKRGDRDAIMHHLKSYGIQGYVEIRGTSEQAMLQIVADALSATGDD